MVTQGRAKGARVVLGRGLPTFFAEGLKTLSTTALARHIRTASRAPTAVVAEIVVVSLEVAHWTRVT